MKRFNVPVVVSALFISIALSSCEAPESQILGLWFIESREQSAYEDGVLRAEATQYYTEEEGIYWEFQDSDMLVYESRSMELEQTYTWRIVNEETLILSSDDSGDGMEFEILSLTRNELKLIQEESDIEGDVLVEYKDILTFKKSEE